MSRHLRVAVVLLVVTGCSSVHPSLRVTALLTAGEESALGEALESFYSGATPGSLRKAVAAARAASPNCARFHEVAAQLALLDGQESLALEHLLSALTDTRDDAPVLHLHQLMSLNQTYAERETVRELLRVLCERHPNPSLRALAAYHLAYLLNSDNQLPQRDAVIASIPGKLHFSLVGTWDNDSGKAFDAELAPEQRPGFEQIYEGRTGRLHWRRDVPADPRGRLDLAAVMTPSRWAAVYAQAVIDTAIEGPRELRLTSTSPIKVWVDGALVFAASQIERSVFDQVVIPLSLTRGTHRILIKSAHREGQWSLAGRLVDASEPAHEVSSVDELVQWQVRQLPQASARAAALRTEWASLAAGSVHAVRFADAAVKAMPRSLIARLEQVEALWFNQERGRTSDLLQTLDADAGDELPFVRLRHIRFQQQQGQKQKARDRLLQLTKSNPNLREAWELLAEFWSAEGWLEDQLLAEATLRKNFGATPEEDVAHATTLIRLGRHAEAIETFEHLLDILPRHPESLRRLADLDLDAGDLTEAQQLLEERLESWPTDFNAWLQLAEVHRRLGHRKQVHVALQSAAALSPEASSPLQREGDLAYQAGETQLALTAWRKALELSPENESLANRIDFLSPEARGPWLADVPSEAAIELAVKHREGLKQTPGADVAWLLDQEVTQLNTDGSTSNVVTHVVHTFNAQGRDRVMRQSVGSGRLRVMASYSVDEKGNRTEASGERARQIFFRGLQPGSTLVLQYRLDTPAQGFLSRYLTKAWQFQSVSEQRLESTYILWASPGVTLNEQRIGQLERTEEKRGGQVRVKWSALNVPPLVAEPSMPPSNELNASVRLSTVPDWKTWLSWERALLDGAFRDSPELDAVVRTLDEGNPSVLEKTRRIHQFVMEEIRYQQDYETFIAGVKPHPAPMTLERKYGDCKDKAVLFIELARKLGVEAHFALVRTREQGPILEGVPSQQFNHAIVYVPKQKGLEKDRFLDPTAELLDLDSLRVDDVATKSLVFDPSSSEITWRDIEPQPPELNRETNTLTLTLDPSGAAKGTLTIEATGRDGSLVRRVSRNTEMLDQAAQRMATAFLPGASTSNVRALETKSLREPARIRTDFESKTFARAEGDSLRMRIPSEWNPRSMFTLAARRHPLVFGAPTQMQTHVSVTLPEGYDVMKLPMASAVELPCLSLTRVINREASVVTSTQTFRSTCERISAAEYVQYRGRVDEMVRMLDDELVIAPVAAKKTAAPAKR